LRRITEIARGHTETVILNARNTSGKTYTLYVVVPGIQKVVVRLHRREHKKFWAIVAAAKAWLEKFKTLFAPVPLLLPAVAATSMTDSQKLVKAAAQMPRKDKSRDMVWSGVMYRPVYAEQINNLRLTLKAENP